MLRQAGITLECSLSGVILKTRNKIKWNKQTKNKQIKIKTEVSHDPIITLFGFIGYKNSILQGQILRKVLFTIAKTWN